MGIKYLTIKELASMEGVTYLTILGWTKKNKLASIVRGGRRLVAETEYQRFLREGNRAEEET